MTRDELVALTNRRLESYRRRDAAALAADHAEDSTVVSPMFATVQGRSAIEASYRQLFTAFPDWDMTGEPPIIDGHRMAQVFRISATHMSDLFGLPGTGKRVEFTCVILFTFENGLIANERRIYDFTGLLLQLGVLKGKVGR